MSPYEPPMPPVFALVDCNNFYASCERLFNPRLIGQPIIVLSNNDGCVIARSNEAKAAGIAMGQPFHECAGLIHRHQIAVFSANFGLYGDLSHRVMQTLERFTSAMEVYSIDEAFLTLPVQPGEDPTPLAHRIRQTIRRETGLPVSVGIGPTRVLAKLANEIAKHTPALNGVANLIPLSDRNDCLARTPVEEIWGIGSRLTRRLAAIGIRTAADLRDADPSRIQTVLTVQGTRIVHELRGRACIHLEDLAAPRKTLTCSRSFGRPVTGLDELREAVVAYVSRAAEKLRAQHSLAEALQICIRTNPFRPTDPQYSATATLRLPVPSDHTPTLAAVAGRAVATIYRSGYVYHKASVLLFGLCEREHRPLDLFASASATDVIRQTRLMTALDSLNATFGRHTVQVASAGLEKPWKMRQNHRSPSFTTRWTELPVVSAGCERPKKKEEMPCTPV
jgi:DNA polymerase V